MFWQDSIMQNLMAFLILEMEFLHPDLNLLIKKKTSKFNQKWAVKNFINILISLRRSCFYGYEDENDTKNLLIQ